jgi:hypothetical protein
MERPTPDLFFVGLALAASAKVLYQLVETSTTKFGGARQVIQ